MTRCPHYVLPSLRYQPRKFKGAVCPACERIAGGRRVLAETAE